MAHVFAAPPERILRLGVWVVLTGCWLMLFPLESARRQALAYHPQDFPFYAQFLARVYDGTRPPAYALNPNGMNAFGFWGTEGESNFHQAIHGEPIKYVEALIYRLAGSLTPVWALRWLVLLAAPAYLMRVAPQRTAGESAWVSLIALLYVLLPSFPFLALYDLRPFAYLVPFFGMATVAVACRRPPLETAVLFALLFLAREEALILGVVLIVMQAVMPGPVPARRRRVTVLALVWLAALAATGAFFAWTGYHNRYEVSHFTWAKLLEFAGRLVTPARALLGALALVLLGSLLALGRRCRLWRDPEWRPWTAYALVFAPLAQQFYAFLLQGLRHRQALNAENVLQLLLYDERWALGGCCVLLAVWLAGFRPSAPRDLRRPARVLLACAALSLVAWIVPPASPARQLLHWRRAAQTAQPVWQFRATADRQAPVLCDYATAQAFFDFPEMLVYQRLPTTMSRDAARYFPANRERLLAWLRDREVTLVFDAPHQVDLEPLCRDAGIAEAQIRRTGNGHYEIWQVAR